jgi:hypothetical protein
LQCSFTLEEDNFLIGKLYIFVFKGIGMENKLIESLSLTLFVFGLLGWLYIAGAALVHPSTLTLPLSHLTQFIREDTFGIICFAVSFISFFIWNLVRKR